MDESLDRAMFVPEKIELSNPKKLTGHFWTATAEVFAASCRAIRLAVHAIRLTVSSAYFSMAVAVPSTPGLARYALLFIRRECLRWKSNTDVEPLCHSSPGKSGIDQLFQLITSDSKLLPRKSLIRHAMAHARLSQYEFSLQRRYRKSYWGATPLKCRMERCC
jgi:hypothetical protein